MSAISSCKKKEIVAPPLTKFPVPAWQVDNTGKYPLSMTAVVDLPLSVKPLFQADDLLGAFVDGECRGIGVLVKVNATLSVYYILVHGTASEQKKIKFTYYSKKTSYKYSTKEFLDFTVDGTYGTPDEPKIVDLSPDS